MSSVLDAWSRRLFGWSVAGHRCTELVTDAVEAAVGQRGGHRHFDRVVSIATRHPEHVWAFTRRAFDFGLVPSIGSIGDCHDCEKNGGVGGRV